VRTVGLGSAIKDHAAYAGEGYLTPVGSCPPFALMRYEGSKGLPKAERKLFRETPLLAVTCILIDLQAALNRPQGERFGVWEKGRSIAR